MTSGDIYMLNRIFSTTGTLSGQLYFSLSLFTSWMVSSQVPSSSGRPPHWRQRPWHCSEAMSVWSAHLGAGRIVINKLLFEQIYDKNYINVTAAKSFRDFLYCKMETKKRPTFSWNRDPLQSEIMKMFRSDSCFSDFWDSCFWHCWIGFPSLLHCAYFPHLQCVIFCLLLC